MFHILNWEIMQSGRVTCQVTHSRQANADSVFRLCCRRRCDSTLVLDANVLLQKSHGKGLSPETNNSGLHATKQKVTPVHKASNTRPVGQWFSNSKLNLTYCICEYSLQCWHKIICITGKWGAKNPNLYKPLAV
jgi:hypothetical protein